MSEKIYIQDNSAVHDLQKLLEDIEIGFKKVSEQLGVKGACTESLERVLSLEENAFINNTDILSEKAAVDSLICKLGAKNTVYDDNDSDAE